RRTTRWAGFEDAGLVIECVDEDLGVKRGVFAELEDVCRPRTVLTTASTTVSVGALQAELRRPGRVVGLHALPPLDATPVVEVVLGADTDSWAVAALDAWLRVLGKTPVVVSDRPGRVARRVTLAYLSEAVQLVADGLPPAAVDRAMRQFGMAR